MSEHKVPTHQTALVATEKGKATIQKDAPVPEPGEGQVLIKVHAAGINPVDWKKLLYNFVGLPHPHGVGTDVSGTVVKLGQGVTDFKVGNDVFTTLNLFKPSGSFAEYAVADTARLAHKGSKLTHVQAAALPVAFLSAWDGFVNVNWEKKQTIFVPGGAGGVGHFIVQLAKIYGLTVFASGGKDESIQVLKDLGVDHILNYSKQNVVEEILKLTDNKGVDHAFDSTYVASSFEQSAKAVKGGGNVVVLGNQPSENVQKILAEKKAKWVYCDLGQYSKPTLSDEVVRVHVAQGLAHARRFFEAGRLKPVITKTFAFHEIQTVLAELQAGKTYNGKTVVDFSKQ